MHGGTVTGGDIGVVGRSEELRRIRAHLLDPGGLPARCLIVGEPGAGKSTVWQAIIEEARAIPFQVVAASGAQAEWQLSFGVARDLVGSVLETVQRDLPAPQRRLLRVLLLLDEPDEGTPDQGSLAVAFLRCLQAVAARGPLLIAVDDIQWMDTGSARLLSSALRRLSTEPVAVLFTRRDGPPPTGDPLATAIRDRDLVVRLGPLSLGATGAVLRDRLEVPIGRPTLRRVHEAAAGNPLFALELARVLTDPSRQATPGAPLTVPDSVGDLLRDRLHGIDPPTLDALGVLAALVSTDLAVLGSALGRDPRDALATAVDAGIVSVGADDATFGHPLLAALAYEVLGPTRQRAIHRHLGDLLSDPEERARHLALGVDRPDGPESDVIETGARTALSRGSPSAAADLAYHAGRLTPPGDHAASARRALLEADGAFAAGETARAAARLDALLAATPAGGDRATLLARRARLHSFANDIPASIEGLRQALTEAGDDEALRGSIEEGLAWGSMLIRSDLDGALEHARSAVASARRIGDPARLAESLATQALAECLTARPWRPTIRDALAVEPRAGSLPATRRPAFALGCCRTCVGDLDGARDAFEALATTATERGEEAMLPSILNRLARVELQAGRWDEAGAHIDDGLSRATESGHGPSVASLLGKRAVLAAYRGQHDAARTDAMTALDLAVGAPFDPSRIDRAVERGGESALWALGEVALVEGRPSDATALLGPMTARLTVAGVREVGEMPWLADLAEAWIVAGEPAEAAPLIHRLEQAAAADDRPADAAIAARLRAMSETAAGDHAVARDRLLAIGPVPGRPFETAQVDLVLGGVQRRLREVRAARDRLERARDAFERLGAAGWAARARAELGRLGGRPRGGLALTPTERAVAGLVGQGRTNRETAAALFLSVHTVEAALTAVYGKLGIRSRTELARRIDDIAAGDP